MQSEFKVWETNRKQLASYLDNYTLEQLNKIPTGFSNNLIWNIGHIIVVQQRLIYGVSGLPMHVSDDLIGRFKSGTKPSRTDDLDTVALLKSLILSLIPITLKDFEEGKFVTYKEFTTGTGFHLASVQDALAFNNYHEGLHLGFMTNIRKFV